MEEPTTPPELLEIMRQNEAAEERLRAELEKAAQEALAEATVETPHLKAEEPAVAEEDPLAGISEEKMQALQEAAEADAMRREEARAMKEARAKLAELEEEEEEGFEDPWNREDKLDPDNWEFEVFDRGAVVLIRVYFCGKNVTSAAVDVANLYFPQMGKTKNRN